MKKRQKIRRKFAAPKRFSELAAGIIRAAFVNPNLFNNLPDIIRAAAAVAERQAEKARFGGLLAPLEALEAGYPTLTVRKAVGVTETLQQVLHEKDRLQQERMTKFRTGGVVAALGGEYVINRANPKRFISFFEEDGPIILNPSCLELGRDLDCAKCPKRPVVIETSLSSDWLKHFLKGPDHA